MENGTYLVKVPDDNTNITVSLPPAFEETYEVPTAPMKTQDDIDVLAEGKILHE